ncbi:Hypothetical protein ACI5QL_01939 [Bacillus velezensis]|uniref:Uncharacterized protein n=1 Tax=Bacillus amyloliquefaciens (strain Y2) TaxID=1155777 RepID=I2C5Y9_BACAY|nr:hypothetical protein MUS_2104 [Bacillus velezensis YAU B9601-Y2]RUS02998.1 hypothetical protein EFW58_04018 [Bacillus velezensis]
MKDFTGAAIGARTSSIVVITVKNVQYPVIKIKTCGRCRKFSPY